MNENLPLLAPDSSRGERTRARCHNRLGARRQRLEARKRRPNPAAVAMERLLLAGVCVVYLISMAGNVIGIAR